MASRWDTVVPNELYQFPRTMPENLVAIRENARRRPYYCYRLFINNVDQYVSREIAKFFFKQRFLTPDMVKKMEKPIKVETLDGLEKDSQKELGKKSKKSSAKISKSPGKRKSRASKSPSKSRASKSPGNQKSRASKSPGKRKSRASKSPGARKSQTGKSAGKRKSQTEKSRKSISKKGSKDKSKRSKIGKPATRAATTEEIETKLEDLWPKYSNSESKYRTNYKFNVDYAKSPNLNTDNSNAFSLIIAREFNGESFEWDERLRRKMKNYAWLYSRYPTADGRIETQADDDWLDGLFLPELMNECTPSKIIEAGDAPAIRAVRSKGQLDITIPNVVTQVEEFRKRLWEEDRGEKSLRFYNEDLLNLDPNFQIIGSRTQPASEEEMDPYYVMDVLPTCTTDRENFTKNIFPCSIIIYDITKSPDSIDEAKTTLDFLIEELRGYSVENRWRNQALYGIHTFIVISPLLTWADTRTLARNTDECLREEYFHKRIPHPLYRKHWEFENYVYAKAYEYRDLLKICILGVGLVYGGGDCDLKPYFETVRKNDGPLIHLGSGYNFVPMIHIDDLARLCLRLTRSFPLYTRYIIAAEKQLRTCREIMDIISQNISGGSVSNVPACFGKAIGHVGVDVHSLLYSKFKVHGTYLHDAIKYEFDHDFGSSFKSTYQQFVNESGYWPIRIILFGPGDADQRKIGEALALHYKIPYLNGFRAVKIFLKILLALQRQVLNSSKPKRQAKDWRLVEGKSEFLMVKTSTPLAWQREHRLLFQRDPKLEELRQNFKVSSGRDINSIKMADFGSVDFFDNEALTSAEPENQKIREIKELLVQLDKIKSNGTDLLPALLRVDTQALIVRELLKFPIFKTSGYVLDGIPTTEEEAKNIFSRDSSVNFAPAKTGAQAGPAEPQDFEFLPTHVFHIKKPVAEAFKDFISEENAESFQKEFMSHFRRMQIHKLITSKSRSALDFFEDQLNMTTHRFDSGSHASSEIVDEIVALIGQRVDEDVLLHSGVEKEVNPNDPEIIKQQLSVYSEDDGNWNGAEKIGIEKHSEMFTSRRVTSQVAEEIPISERVFTPEEIDEANEVGERLVHEISQLTGKSLNYINYLTKFAAKSVLNACINAAEEKPPGVVDWTAFYLMANNTEGGRMPKELMAPPEKPPNLSVYPFNVDKFDRNLVSHLE